MRETAATYDAILAGVIIEVRYFRAPRPPAKGEVPLDEMVATVALNRRWRGTGPDTVVVRTPAGTAACGLDLMEGQEYLLFARQANGDLYADKCGPSRRWDDEAERLAELLGRGDGVH